MIEPVDPIPVEPVYAFTPIVLLLLIAACIGINFWMRRKRSTSSMRRANAISIRRAIGWLILFAAGASMAWQNVRYMFFSHPLGEFRYPAPAVVAVLIGLAMVAISLGFFFVDIRRARQTSMPNP